MLSPRETRWSCAGSAASGSVTATPERAATQRPGTASVSPRSGCRSSRWGRGSASWSTPSRMRKNSTFDGRVGERFGYDARNSHQGGAHAGGRSPAGRNVELPVAGAARTRGPSAAPDPGDGGHDPGRAVPRVRHALFPGGAAVDPAGEAVAGPAVAGPLQHAQRAAPDGATGLQPALPLVRRAEHG